MKNNEDEKTVSCFDLILPKIGELAGGSVRENDYQLLFSKLRNRQIDSNNLD